jgi:hypothetical protein
MAAKDSTRIPPTQPLPRIYRGDLVISLQEMIERCNPHDPFLGPIHDEIFGLVRTRIDEVVDRVNRLKEPLSVDEVLDRIRRCDYCDGWRDCTARATVHVIETEEDLCLRYFEKL